MILSVASLVAVSATPGAAQHAVAPVPPPQRFVAEPEARSRVAAVAARPAVELPRKTVPWPARNVAAPRPAPPPRVEID